MIKFMLITNDPDLAHYAEDCGVGRIFVDLELLGKQERQGHLDTLISRHSMKDVSKVKSKLTEAELLVRLNPIHSGTKKEIELAILGGADLLMLPMFRGVKEVREFCEMVDGRVGVIPLVETFSAAEALQDIVRVSGVTEVYIGLNDLHLDMKLKFMFEPIVDGLLDSMSEIIRSSGLPFGFGGIARVGEGVIPGEMILGEHLRLGSSSVILSRTFHRKSEGASEFKGNLDLKVELDKLHVEAENLKIRNPEQIEDEHQYLRSVISDFVASRK